MKINKTLAILAGGKSSRMNYNNKALLSYKEKTFIEHIIEAGENFKKVVIVANNKELYSDFNVDVISDIYVGNGPLSGIHSALSYSDTDKVLCVACDMPLISKDTLEFLANVKEEYEVLVPRVNDRLQPLCSIYSKKILGKIEKALENDDNKLQKLIYSLDYKEVHEKSLTEGEFFNINTPDDYKRLEEIDNMYTVAIITSSDKVYAGEREDKSGATVKEIVEANGFTVVKQVILPDEREMLRDEMIKMCDELKVNLILSTGGTGFSKRDITPEATKDVIEREAPGIVEAIRYFSLQITKRAMLSRAVSGIRKDTLIVNLPGSPKACKEALDFVLDDVKHGIDILLGEARECARK